MNFSERQGPWRVCQENPVSDLKQTGEALVLPRSRRERSRVVEHYTFLLEAVSCVSQEAAEPQIKDILHITFNSRVQN